MKLNDDYIYYLCSGTVLLEQAFQNKRNNHTLIPSGRFLQIPFTYHTSTILALENSEMIFFNKKNLFDVLEKENTLVDFIWYLTRDVHKTLHTNLFPHHWSTRKKLLCTLKEIAKMSTRRASTNSMVLLPNWLKKKHLSLLCHCSFRAVHYNLKKLEKEKVLVFYASTKKIDLDKLAKMIKN